MGKKNKDNEQLKNQEEASRNQRIEEAKRIASKSQQIIDKNYNILVKYLIKASRQFNSKLDIILQNSFFRKLTAVLLAVILYFSINYSGDISIFGKSNFGKELYGIEVEAIYDKNKYQVENIPKTVDISLVGSLEAIRKTETLKKERAILDLTNYKAGIDQNVTLTYGGVANNVSVKFSQSTFSVNIYDKYKKKFKITPEIIKQAPNDNKTYDINYLQNTIEIKAAQHTLDRIASVKALVDVSNLKNNSRQQAKLIVVDSLGNKIEDITLSFDSISVNINVKDGK